MALTPKKDTQILKTANQLRGYWRHLGKAVDKISEHVGPRELLDVASTVAPYELRKFQTLVYHM